MMKYLVDNAGDLEYLQNFSADFISRLTDTVKLSDPTISRVENSVTLTGYAKTDVVIIDEFGAVLKGVVVDSAQSTIVAVYSVNGIEFILKVFNSEE